MASFPMTTERQGQERRSISSRLVGLAHAVEGTRRGTRFDVRQLMLAAGATSMALGIVAIVLGWYGAAHSSYLFQEIPYLISGGLLGVALVAGGGFLFFASWFVRMIEDNHRYAARVEQTLSRVDHVLGAIATDAAASEDEPRAGDGATRIGAAFARAGEAHPEPPADGGSSWRFTEGPRS